MEHKEDNSNKEVKMELKADKVGQCKLLLDLLRLWPLTIHPIQLVNSKLVLEVLVSKECTTQTWEVKLLLALPLRVQINKDNWTWMVQLHVKIEC